MQLEAAVTGVGALITGHLWLIVVAAAVPAVPACTTAIVLVLSVEPGRRVDAIKALPPVISAVNKTALSNLIGPAPRAPAQHNCDWCRWPRRCLLNPLCNLETVSTLCGLGQVIGSAGCRMLI